MPVSSMTSNSSFEASLRKPREEAAACRRAQSFELAVVPGDRLSEGAVDIQSDDTHAPSVKRSDQARAFVVLPRRWIVERTFACARPMPKAREGLGKSQPQSARFPAPRLHQAHVEKAMQSRITLRTNSQPNVYRRPARAFVLSAPRVPDGLTLSPSPFREKEDSKAPTDHIPDNGHRRALPQDHARRVLPRRLPKEDLRHDRRPAGRPRSLDARVQRGRELIRENGASERRPCRPSLTPCLSREKNSFRSSTEINPLPHDQIRPAHAVRQIK